VVVHCKHSRIAPVVGISQDLFGSNAKSKNGKVLNIQAIVSSINPDSALLPKN
jgi:hypothetical protein